MTKTQSPARSDLPPITILNVCADEARRCRLNEILQKAGFKVRDGTTGTEALHLANEQPGLILLDLSLPDMSGFEVCCRIKAHAATAAIPILHLSPALVEGQGHSDHLEQGDEPYLTHPVGAAVLITTVKTLLSERQAERQFHEFLEAAPDAVVIVDQYGKIARVNGQAEAMFGYGREELTGQEVEILIPKRFQDRHRQQRAGFMSRPTTRPMGSGLELWGLRKDGSEFPVEISLSPLPTQEGFLISSIIRDATKRRRMEQALREADRHKDEFLAMLAHELRNPLIPIRSAVQVLKAVDPSDPRHDWARDVIDRQAAQLALLVEDLLDVSRIIHGKLKLRKEPVELGPLIAEAIEASRPNIDARTQQLTVVLPTKTVRLDADPSRLVQVWTNLLNNAAKYTEKGGRIWVSAEVLDGHVEVRVRDTGIGVSQEMLPGIFDLFTQIGGSQDRSQGGLGVGLAMVARLVQMHGGTVHALSEGLGKGSEFVTCLPVLLEAPQVAAKLEAISLDQSVPRRILLVDDNVDLVESMAWLLERHGHEVQIAYDGPSAIEAAKNLQPEVVFMDIGLPGMSGYDVARCLRTQMGSDKLLLVAVSGFGEEKEHRLAFEAGFDEYLLKPFSSDLVRRLVARGRVQE